MESIQIATFQIWYNRHAGALQAVRFRPVPFPRGIMLHGFCNAVYDGSATVGGK